MSYDENPTSILKRMQGENSKIILQTDLLGVAVRMRNGWLIDIQKVLFFAEQRSWNHIINGRIDGGPQKVELGFLDNPKLIAKTHLVKKTDVIVLGINNLSIYEGIFRAILSHGFLFPDIGNENTEQSPFMFDDCIKRLQNTLEDWPKECLCDSAREQLARELAQGAFLNIYFHEFAHVRYGHTSYLNEVEEGRIEKPFDQNFLA